MSRRKVLDRERKAREKKKAENKRRIPLSVLPYFCRPESSWSLMPS